MVFALKKPKNARKKAKTGRIFPPHIALLRKKLIPILRKHKVKKAGVFGSYARGDFGKRSDVDLLVQLGSNYRLLDIVGMKLDAQNAFRKKVDIVEYCAIKPALRKKILSEEVRLI